LRLANVQAQAIAALFDASIAKVDLKIVTHYVDRVRAVHDTTQTMQREIPLYVTPATDRTFPLPVGFVRVHDAAATGVLPGPAGDADATASDVTASQAATVIASNYGTCLEIREQLNAVLDRIDATAALPSTPP
jgi:2-methylcitrate dehydratase PrpD